MLNALIRVIYRIAHLGLRVVWFVRRPETTGALVAAWYNGRVLLVRNSYRKQLTLPGGYVRAHEERRTAAARELEEEVGIAIQPRRLKHAYHATHPFESRKDTLDIFEIELDAEPTIQIDNREVVWAEFKTPQELSEMNLVPHLDEYLAKRSGG